GGPQDGFEIRSQFGASRREKVTAGLAQIDDRRPGVAFFESGFIVSYGRLDAFADESRELFRRPAGRRTAGQGIVERRGERRPPDGLVGIEPRAFELLHPGEVFAAFPELRAGYAAAFHRFDDLVALDHR